MHIGQNSSAPENSLPQLGQARRASVLIDLSVLWLQSEPKAHHARDLFRNPERKANTIFIGGDRVTRGNRGDEEGRAQVTGRLWLRRLNLFCSDIAKGYLFA